MKIVTATTGHTDIKAPDFTPVSDAQFTAAIVDDGRLVLIYQEPQPEAGDKFLVMGFNSYETSKIRSVLNKGG